MEHRRRPELESPRDGKRSRRASDERRDEMLDALLIFDRLAAGAAGLGSALRYALIKLKFVNKAHRFDVLLRDGRIRTYGGKAQIGGPVAWSPDVLATWVRPRLRSWLDAAREPVVLDHASSMFMIDGMTMFSNITGTFTQLLIADDRQTGFTSLAPFEPFFRGMRSKERPGSVTACSVALERARQTGWIDGSLDDLGVLQVRATISESALGPRGRAYAVRPVGAAEYDAARAGRFALARRAMEAAAFETRGGRPSRVKATLHRRLEHPGGALYAPRALTSVAALDASERSGEWDVLELVVHSKGNVPQRVSLLRDEVRVPGGVPWLDRLMAPHPGRVGRR